MALVNFSTVVLIKSIVFGYYAIGLKHSFSSSPSSALYTTRRLANDVQARFTMATRSLIHYACTDSGLSPSEKPYRRGRGRKRLIFPRIWVSYEGALYQFKTTSDMNVCFLLESAFGRLVPQNGRKLSEYQLQFRGKVVQNSARIADLADSDEPFELIPRARAVYGTSPAEIVAILRNASSSKMRWDKIITPRSLEIPFILRQDAIKILTETIINEANLSPEQKFDKNCHHIPVLSTISGFGKTRTLLQMNEVLSKLNTNQRVSGYGRTYTSPSIRATRSLSGSFPPLLWRRYLRGGCCIFTLLRI
jgi:hypothetical protein